MLGYLWPWLGPLRTTEQYIFVDNVMFSHNGAYTIQVTRYGVWLWKPKMRNVVIYAKLP